MSSKLLMWSVAAVLVTVAACTSTPAARDDLSGVTSDVASPSAVARPAPTPSVTRHPTLTGSGERVTVAPGLVEYEPSVRQIGTGTGTCNNPETDLEVRETATSVELIVTVVDVSNDDDCLDWVSAVLDAPLGERTVRDGVTGTPALDVRRHTHVAGATTTLSPLPDEPLNVIPREGHVEGVCNSDLVLAAADLLLYPQELPPEALADGPPIAVGSHEVRPLKGLPPTMVLAQKSRLHGCEDTPWFLSIPAADTPWATPVDKDAVCDAIMQDADSAPCDLEAPAS